MNANKLTRDLFAGVNEPADRQNLTDLEKKHIPVIDAPASVRRCQRFTATVEVGKLLPHNNEYGHSIEFIELYADDLFLAKADLTAVNTCPKVTFCLSLSGPVKELRAYGRCNLHGVWVARSPVAVTD